MPSTPACAARAQLWPAGRAFACAGSGQPPVTRAVQPAISARFSGCLHRTTTAPPTSLRGGRIHGTELVEEDEAASGAHGQPLREDLHRRRWRAVAAHAPLAGHEVFYGDAVGIRLARRQGSVTSRRWCCSEEAEKWHFNPKMLATYSQWSYMV